MIKALLKWNIKSNWGIFAFTSGLMLIYSITSLSTYNIDNMEALLSMMEAMPQELMKAMGFDGLTSDLTFFLGAFLYGFILLIFPLIYTVTTGIRLVVEQVDSGSMVYLLATPHSRRKLMVNQALFHSASTVILMLFQVGILMVLAKLLFPGKLVVDRFLLLNLVTISVLLVSSGITFLSSCIFNETRTALIVGAGIPIVSFLFRMVSEIDDAYEAFKYVSYYASVVPERIFNDYGYAYGVSFTLLAAAVLLYGLGIMIFDKRSLTI